MSNTAEIRALKKLGFTALLFLATGAFYLEAACSFSNSPSYPVLESGSYTREVSQGLALRSTVDIVANPGDQVRWNWAKNSFAAQSTFTDLADGVNTFTIPPEHPAGGIFALVPRYTIPADSNFNTDDAGDYKVKITLLCNGNQNQSSPETRISVIPKQLTAPINISGNRGANISFTSSFQGTHVAYQWYLNGAALTNGSGPGTYSGVTTNTLTLNGFQASTARQGYTVRARNTYWNDGGMSRESSSVTSVLNSANRASFSTDGICSGTQANGATAPDPANGLVYLNNYFELNWDSYNSGLGSECSVQTLANVGTVASCYDYPRFGSYRYFFKVGFGDITTDIQTQYVYEKQNGPGWDALTNDAYTTTWYDDAGPGYNQYADELEDSGNYRLRVTQQPCAAAATFPAIGITVQATPITLSALTVDGYYGPSVDRFIGQNGSFYVSISSGTAQGPYTWALQKWNGSAFVDSIVDTSYTEYTYAQINPYQGSGASGLRDNLDDGRYRIRFTDSNTPTPTTLYTNEIQLNVTKRPQTADPLLSNPVTVEDGGRAYMVANVFGGDGPYTYTWETRANSFSSWGTVAGCSSSLSICQTPILRRSTDMAREFRVRVYTESPADERASNVAGVNILVANPQILAGPQNVSINVGQSANFNVVATGSPNLQYQWRRNGANISGATSSSYVLSNAQTSDSGSTFDVVVSHTASGNTATSSAASLTVNSSPGPNITQQPSSIFIVTAGSGSLSVQTSPSADHSYQWYKDNGAGFAVVPGATAASFAISNANSSHAGNYRVRVTRVSSGQQQDSAIAAVTVIPAITITTQPANLSLSTSQAGQIFVVATGTNLQYQWFRRSGPSSIAVSDVSGRISGSQTSTLNFISPLTGDAGTYYVQITDAATQTVNSIDATLTVTTPPSITTQPASQTQVAGTDAVFTVVASGATSYQWFKDGGAISDARYLGVNTSQLRITNTIAADAGIYTVVVSNAVGSLTSNAASLTILPPVQITTHPTGVSVQAGNSITLSVVATGPNPLSYQWRKNSTNISGANLPIYFIPAAATGDAGQYDVVVRHVASGSQATSNQANVSVTSAPPGPNITLNPVDTAARVGQPASFLVSVDPLPEHNFQWQKEVAGNFVNIGGQNSALLTLPSVVSGDAGRYRVVVVRNSISVNSSPATLSVVAPMQITQQPVSIERGVGGSGTFTVLATGTGLTYQWFKSVGGSDVPLTNSINRVSGAQTESLTLSSLIIADAGQYRVRVRDATSDERMSNYATLTVSEPVSITTQPLTQTVYSPGAANFLVQATGSGTLTYRWKKGSTVLSDGGKYSGTATSQLMVNNTANADEAIYSVEVSNSLGTVTSQGANLIVNYRPSILVQPMDANPSVGGIISLNVTASAEPAPTYQWYKAGVPLTNSGRVLGVTTTNLVISGVQTTDAGQYSVRVSNAGGDLDSRNAVVTVDTAGVCSTPNTPVPQSPIGGANTTQSPQFNWSTVVHGTAGCGITYNLTLSTQSSCTSATAGRFNFNNLVAASLNFPATLPASQNYFWCVQSVATGDVASAWSAPQEFRVQSGDIPVPVVQIFPAGTSSVFPAGETEILVSLTGGEAGALAILYEVQGGERVIVGQRAYNSAGAVDFIVPLSDISEVRRFDYQGVTQRGGVSGAYSLVASYYFDPDLILDPAPILTDSADGDFVLNGSQMNFTKVTNATGYEVYRRVGLEDCNNQVDVCFLNSSPFKRLVRFEVGDSLPASVTDEGGYFRFTDSEQASLVPTPVNSGVSYFVVGFNDRSRTVRSKSVSYRDTLMINILRNAEGDPISPTLAIRTLPDGRTIQVWATNLGGYGLDNSADLVAHVLYKAIPDNVPPGVDPLSLISFTTLDGLNTHDQTADTLRRITIDGTIQNAILLSEHVGEPGKIYAHLVCLKDVSGNPTNPVEDQHCFRPRLSPRLIDETAPDFAGVSRLTALADGKSLKVEWPAAVGFTPDDPNGPVGAEVIQYEVVYTSAFDSQRRPDFTRGSAKIVEDTENLSTTLTGLRTDTEYAVFVRAVDQVPNRTDGGVVLREKTLNNNPYPSGVEFRFGAQPGEVLLRIDVSDRNIELGDRVRLASLQVGDTARAMSAVERLSDRMVGSSSRAVTALGGNNQTIEVRLDLSDVLRTDILGGFFYALEIEDQEGNRGRVEGKGRLVDGLANGASGFVNANAGGGCARMTGKESDLSMPLALLALLGLGLASLYRSRARSARRLASAK